MTVLFSIIVKKEKSTIRRLYLGLSGLGGLSIKLLLVALEMGMTGIFFSNDEGSEVT